MLKLAHQIEHLWDAEEGRSMAGATTRMAMVVCELQSVFDTLDLSKAGEMEPTWPARQSVANGW